MRVCNEFHSWLLSLYIQRLTTIYDYDDDDDDEDDDDEDANKSRFIGEWSESSTAF